MYSTLDFSIHFWNFKLIMIATVLLAREKGHKYCKVNFVVVCFIYSIWFIIMYMYMYHVHKLVFQDLNSYTDINRASSNLHVHQSELIKEYKVIAKSVPECPYSMTHNKQLKQEVFSTVSVSSYCKKC